MACHTTDGIYAIMDCGYAETAERHLEALRGIPGIEAWWRDGTYATDLTAASSAAALLGLATLEPVPRLGGVLRLLFLAALLAMERDLHEHIHKENNILHPRAALLEESLLAAAGGQS